MLVRLSLGSSKFFLRPAFEHLKETLSVEINWIDQVDGVVNQPLLDQVIQEGVAGEGRTRIDLQEPPLHVFVENHIEPVQVEAIWVKSDIVLRCHQRLKADLLDLGPANVVPVDVQIFDECLFESGEADLGASIDPVLLIAVVILQVVLVDRHVGQVDIFVCLVRRV